MVWKELSVVDQRREFVSLAKQEDANISALCQRFGISRKTGYKWLKRYRPDNLASLEDRPRKPQKSPKQTKSNIEAKVIELRKQHPAWGGRKLRRRLQDLGHADIPAASTITGILHRHNLISPEASDSAKHYSSFEALEPNTLWQMDFKGHFAMSGQRAGRCHPLTIVDDHSRYAIAVQACDNEQTMTVKGKLVQCFETYGLPNAIYVDNGSPWGVSDEGRFITPLGVWLIRLGIRIIHGSPYYPQGRGKSERFNRTLKTEVIQGYAITDMLHAQQCFDKWRTVYNYERPHDELELDVPASRYKMSKRSYPVCLPNIEYVSGTIVRMVNRDGKIRYQGQKFRVPKALKNHPVAIKPTQQDGLFDVYFCHQKVREINLVAV